MFQSIPGQRITDAKKNVESVKWMRPDQQGGLGDHFAIPIDDWADRHGPGPEDPDHVEYHAHCCPDCCGEVAS